MIVGQNSTEIEKLDPEVAAAATANAVQKINMLLLGTQREASFKELPKVTGLNHESEVLDPMKEDLKGAISALNSDLQTLLAEGLLTPDEGEEAKITGIAQAIKDVCKGNGDCIKALEDAIKEGIIPLENDGKSNANSAKNPYAAKEEKKPAEKLGKDGKEGEGTQPPAEGGPKRPSLQDIQDALAAIARYMKGQKAENLFKLDKFCDPKEKSDDTTILSRSINAIGMLGTTDPFLWYLGKSVKIVEAE